MTRHGLALLALVAACDHSVPEPAQARPAAAPTLEVVPVTSRKLETTISLPGELAAYETVAVHPRVTGFVEEVAVDRGSRVRRGQLLARLSAPELAAQRA